MEAHSDAHDLGGIADVAGVKLFVLSHLASTTVDDQVWLSQFTRTLGQAVVGKPLMSFVLPVQ